MQKVAILYDASQAVLSTFHLDEVLSSILKILRDYFQLQNAAVLLIDPRSGDLHVRSEFGRIRASSVVPKGMGITGTAVRLKRPVYAPDVSKDSRYLLGDDSTKCELAIPLIVRDEVVGVLDMQSETLDFFDKNTIDLLTLFSTQASIAIENARLYSREQRRAEQLEAINAVARQTTSLVELDHLLEKVCKEMLERFHIDQVAILLLEGAELYHRAHMGKLTATRTIGERIPLTGFAGRSLETGRSVLVNDVNSAQGFIRGVAETRSELCVPLIVYGEKLGVMVLDSAREDAFDEEDVPALESVADICAAAIQNAHHFERTRDLAYLDGLTGIFNRRFFEMRVREELERAQRYNTNLAVVMLDIDYFKKLNDEFGHLLGDEVLRQVSTMFQQQLRKGDVVCRYGGEEFALVLPEIDAEAALGRARQLVEACRALRPTFRGEPIGPVTISAGVAMLTPSNEGAADLLHRADTALYAAKHSGRDQAVQAGVEVEAQSAA